jgi:hypothetical protein
MKNMVKDECGWKVATNWTHLRAFGAFVGGGYAKPCPVQCMLYTKSKGPNIHHTCLMNKKNWTKLNKWIVMNNKSGLNHIGICYNLWGPMAWKCEKRATMNLCGDEGGFNDLWEKLQFRNQNWFMFQIFVTGNLYILMFIRNKFYIGAKH